MKKIKVKILGHPITDTFGYSYFILTTLKKYYDVELSDTPDYLFYHDSTYDHYKYDCIKIFYTGENISPNFNLCDYAFGFDFMTFEDRYYRMPLYLVAVFYNQDELAIAGNDYLNKKTIFTKDTLSGKTEFCSFVYSNYRAEEQRKLMFDTLNQYKKVNAAGSYLNNTNGEKVKNKLEFELHHKFSIAFENSSRSGYTTEKLVGALVANTIPIYWGNPNIGKEFNEKRFINCHKYESFDKVLEKIKELDINDELYLQTINEPIAAEGYDFNDVKNKFELFLRNIIDQPLERAKRRTVNPVQAIALRKNNEIIFHYITIKTAILKLVAKIYKPFKKIRFLEDLKYKYYKIK